MANTNDLLAELRIDRSKRLDPAAVRKRKWLMRGGILAVVLVLFFGLRACMSMRPIEVETARAQSAESMVGGSVLDAAGYVTARRQATVSSKITGKVIEVTIEEGQSVKEGEILARLESTEADARHASSLAQLDSATAQIEEVRAQLNQAELELQRQQGMMQKQLTSKQALDNANAQARTLRARLNSATKQAATARANSREASIGQDNTIVRAPFSGVVTVKAAQPGEMISPISAGGGFTRTGIGTIVDMDSLEVQVDVNEAYIGRVTPAMKVETVLNAYPDWKIPGNVIAIIPTADRTKATVKVRIGLDIKDAKIVPDMGARVSFLEEKRADAPKPVGAWVPSNAITKVGEQTVVYLMEQNVAKKIEVSTGDIRDADQHITKGLRGGETVIINPAKNMRDGARVVARANDSTADKK